MNIFGIEYDPERKNPFPEAVESAVAQCDKHIVKMPIEYAQLMSTAHRILDGTMYWGRTKNNRKGKRGR